MSLLPNITELVARARADLRMGVPIVLSDGLVVCAIETLTHDRFADLQTLGGLTVITVTDRRAKTLKARAYDGDIARIIVPEDATMTWSHSIADPSGDLNYPMKGPLKTLRNGSAGPHRAAIMLVKAARLLPAVISTEIDNPTDFAAAHNLTIVSSAAIANEAPTAVHRTIHARLPIEVSQVGRLHVFRPDDGGEEHYAVEIGKPSRGKPILTRLHSACFTGDVLGSLKCDCGPQLRGALAQMGAEGEGVLLYLSQEGRGIGLANKMRAYFLQDQGFDTVEANHRLGFEDDERDFRVGAEILRSMGFSKIRLMTNNPRKVERLSSCGLEVVERVALKEGKGRFNEDYLATKAAKSGHLL